jgi:hypothetical protein
VSWFRAEDRQAARAAAEALKFSIIDIQTEAEKALTLGVHEGVLKGSGRMIVGSVSSEVYRRIEDYVRKAGTEPSPRPENTETTPAAPAPGQTMNIATAGAAVASVSPLKNADPTPPDSRPVIVADSAASPTCKPDTVIADRDLWNALGIGSHVVAKYWQKDGTPYGWWIGVVTGIDKNDFIVRWPDEPKTPPLKIERQHIAILHPAYDVTRERQRRR